MPHPITFGSWLQQRRKALGFTQSDLAGRVGCSPQTIYKIEAGQRRPSEQIVRLIAGQLQVAAHELDAFIRFARTNADAPAVDEHLLQAPWRSRFLPPHNLPTQLTSFVGRAHDLDQAVQIVTAENTRLLTLVGPPGVGKTRLSIEVGNRVLARFKDGVFFVQFEAIADAELFSPTIARALDIYETNARVPVEGLKRYLYERELLLILDNFEQLLEAAPLVTDLLSACPLVKSIITSREPLRVRGERRFPVPALSLPRGDIVHAQDIPTASESSAVELFIQRAQAVQPDFDLTPQNAAAVAVLCADLDGLPLAIEIVSARVECLPPEKLVLEMRGDGLLESGGWRDVSPRQQTLNAAIDWSYRLLGSHDQQLFRQFGIFPGGATLAAVNGSCGPAVDVLQRLTALVDKNLLLRDQPVESLQRFRMLQTLREYALWRLKSSGEFADLQNRFAAFFLRWVTEAETALRGHEQVAWIERIDREHDNLRAVLDFYVAERDWHSALRMAGALFEFWVYRGYISEGLRRLRYILNASASVSVDLSLRAKASNGVAMLGYFAGDYEAIIPNAEEALRLSRSIHDNWNVALASMSLGMALAGQRFFDQAIRRFEVGLAAARETGEDWLIATLLNGLGEVARSRGDFDQASVLLTSSLELAEASGHLWLLTHVLDNLGHVAQSEAVFDRAAAFYRQSLDASLKLNDLRGVAMCLEKLGGLAVAQGDAVRAARLLGAAEALRELKNAPVEGMDRQDYASSVAATRDSLNNERFQTAWLEGRQMAVEDAIAYATG